MFKSWKGFAITLGAGLVLLGLAVGGGYILGRGTLAGDLARAESAAVAARIAAAESARARELHLKAFANLSGWIDRVVSGAQESYARSERRYDTSLKRLAASRSVNDRLAGYAELARQCADDFDEFNRRLGELGIYSDNGD